MGSKMHCGVRLPGSGKLELKVLKSLPKDGTSELLTSGSPWGPERGRAPQRASGWAGAANNKARSAAPQPALHPGPEAQPLIWALLLPHLCEDPDPKLLRWQEAAGNSWELLLLLATSWNVLWIMCPWAAGGPWLDLKLNLARGSGALSYLRVSPDSGEKLHNLSEKAKAALLAFPGMERLWEAPAHPFTFSKDGAQESGQIRPWLSFTNTQRRSRVR